MALIHICVCLPACCADAYLKEEKQRLHAVMHVVKWVLLPVLYTQSSKLCRAQYACL